jgi:hypothetical protein
MGFELQLAFLEAAVDAYIASNKWFLEAASQPPLEEAIA